MVYHNIFVLREIMQRAYLNLSNSIPNWLNRAHILSTIVSKNAIAQNKICGEKATIETTTQHGERMLPI